MSDHAWNCDYAQDPVPENPECYCPMPGEERLPCGHLREEEHLYECASLDEPSSCSCCGSVARGDREVIAEDIGGLVFCDDDWHDALEGDSGC